jgi:hypothetical protein
VVERGGLENRCAPYGVPWVRIPPPPLDGTSSLYRAGTPLVYEAEGHRFLFRRAGGPVRWRQGTVVAVGALTVALVGALAASAPASFPGKREGSPSPGESLVRSGTESK